MLSFEEFQEYVKENIKDFLPEELQSAEVKIISVTKNNGLKLQGLSVLPEGENVSPSIYLESFYETYQDGRSLSGIMQQIANTTMKHMSPEGLETVGMDLKNFDYVKDKIIMVAVNREKNEELLKEIPHTYREDLAIIYKVLVGLSDCEYSSVTIRNEYMNFWDASTDMIHELAMANTRELLPTTVQSMSEVVKEMFEKDGLDPELCDAAFNKQRMEEQMFVISNKLRINGAANIFYEDVLAEIADRIGTDLYILPSSIHECIAVSTHTATVEELAEMVESVNACEVAEAEQLSDHVYYYDAKNRTLSLADTSVEELGLKAAEDSQEYNKTEVNEEVAHPRKHR